MLEARDLPLLTVFAAVVRHGSFVAAARALRLSKSTVSEQVQALEQRCGVRLLQRTTRSLRPTQVGLQVHASAEHALGILDTVRHVVERDTQAVTGVLHVAATLDLGVHCVAPAIARLCAEHPQLRAELSFDDREVDWQALGADVAVRHGQPRDSSCISRKLAGDKEVIVAAPALASRWRRLRDPLGLRDAPWVLHQHLANTRAHPLRGAEGQRKALHGLDVRATASTVAGVRTLAMAGLGFTMLPQSLVREDLAAKRLVPVLPAWHRRRISIYALLPVRRPLPPRVTLFMEALGQALHRSVDPNNDSGPG